MTNGLGRSALTGHKRTARAAALATAVVMLAASAVAVAATTRSTTATVNQHQTGHATAVCPRGTAALAGGVRGDATQSGPYVYPNALVRPSARRISGRAANGGSAGSGSLTAIAYCGRPSHLEAASASVSIGENQQGSVTVTCPRGTTVRLGGFQAAVDAADVFSGSDVAVNGLTSPSARRWTVAGFNLGSHTGTLKAIAYCGHGGRLVRATTTVSVASGHVGTAVARCAHGRSLVFGGLRVQHYGLGAGDIAITDLERASRTAWRVRGLKFRPTAGHMTAIAYCG